MLKIRFAVLVVTAMTCASALDAAAASDRPDGAAKLDNALRDPALGGEVRRVIVRYAPGAEAALEKQLQKSGGKIERRHRGLDSFTADVGRKDLQTLAENPNVLGISLDAVVSVGEPSPPKTEDGVPITRSYDVQALRATLGLTSADTSGGVGVAIIDSGIAAVPDLASRIVAFYDFTRGGVAAAPFDDFGHGTHVAGLIAGSGAQSRGRYVGVSHARLIGLKVLDASGRGLTSTVVDAIEFAVANRAALGIDVINLSLGHPIYEPARTDPLVRAVEKAVKSGIVVVTSAGNLGVDRTTGTTAYAGITSPGNAPSAITVGAVSHGNTADRADDAIARFSSRGPTWYDGLAKPDVLAPGQGLIAVSSRESTLGRDARFAADIRPYLKLSGTSMASAVATGVVAHVIAANRQDEGPHVPLTPNTVKAILQYTAIPLPDDDGSTPAILEQGAGAINAAGAMTLARAIDPSVRKKRWWIEYPFVPISRIGGRYLPWAQHIVWGDHVVWGDSILRSLAAWDDHIVWGDNIVWGEAIFEGPGLVEESFGAWGSAVVWGNGLVSLKATHIVWGEIDDHIVWGERLDDDHIVWGERLDDDHVVWGSSFGQAN